MTDNRVIRPGEAADTPAIEQIYRDAFPDEDLVPLVKQLLAFGPGVLSMAVVHDDSVAGHVCFTECEVEGSSETVSLLGPLAVAPSLHKQGIGSQLVRAGLERVRETDAALVCVLGDPAYYGRFGFEAERSVEPPHPLPPEWDGAWQSIHLGDNADALKGGLCVPEPWAAKSLWSP